MEQVEKLEKKVALRSAATYVSISLFAALVFLAAATWVGTYTPVARFGGAAWVFLLSMIVSMPLVTGYFKRRSASH